MKIFVATVILASSLLLFGCANKEAAISPSSVQGPPDLAGLAEANDAVIAQLGTEYRTGTGAIAFTKIYRCEFLVGGTKEYKNAVVLEISADSMEAAQEVLKNTSPGRLLNQTNTTYQIPNGYTLLRDPVSNQISLVYQTGAKIFAPDFQYFVVGDFASGDSKALPLIFDTGDLLSEVDITPFRPQELPPDVTLELLNEILVENLGDSATTAQITIDDGKITVAGDAVYRGSRSATQNDGRYLYDAARRTLGRYGLHLDSYTLTLTDESGNPAYLLHNLDFWNNPNNFYLDNCKNETDSQYLDLFSAPGEGVSATITLDEYNKINVGDSLASVKKTIGGPGERLSSVDIVGIKSEMYAWYGENGYSSATFLFQDDKLVTMSQFGLT